MTCDYIIPVALIKDRRKSIFEVVSSCCKACTHDSLHNFVLVMSEDYFNGDLCFTKAILNNNVFIDFIADMFEKKYSKVGVKFMIVTGDAYSYNIYTNKGLIE